MRPQLAVAAVLAAGAFVAGGYYLWPKPRHIDACVPQHAPVPPAAKRALAAYAGRIRHEVQRSNQGSRDESWSDPVTGRSRQVSYRSGRPEVAYGEVPRGPRMNTVFVTYDGKTWTTDRGRAFPRTTTNEAAAEAQARRDEVAQRKARIVGRAVIDGRTTLHLEELMHLPKPTAPSGMHLPKALLHPRVLHVDIWVDPLTYVPIRTRTSGSFGWSVSDTAWLPRTPANIAKTRLVIPAGFRKLTGQSTWVEFTDAATVRCGQS
jgi:hypothetical protein